MRNLTPFLSQFLNRWMNFTLTKVGFVLFQRTLAYFCPAKSVEIKSGDWINSKKDKNVKRFKIMQLFSLSCFHFNLQLELLKIRVIFTVHSLQQHYSAWCNYLLSIMIGNNNSWRIWQNIEYNYPLLIMIGSNDSWII